MRHITEKNCKNCGIAFMGGPTAQYCPICREERKRKTDREYKDRKRRGLSRKVGEIQTCIDCGCKYAFYIGASERCRECAEKRGKIIDRQKSKEWNRNNKSEYLAAKRKYEKTLRENSETIKTGHKYVTYDRGKRKYRVVVKGKHVGYFNDLSDAIRAKEDVLKTQNN